MKAGTSTIFVGEPGHAYAFFSKATDNVGSREQKDPAAEAETAFARRVRGDLNCDDVVSFDDIDPFTLALAGATAYEAQYHDCNWLHADCNGDGAVNLEDIEEFVALVSCGTHGLRGDLNCDGVVTFDDINPLVLALSNPAEYEAAYPGCIGTGDINGDGTTGFSDINPFVALLSGGG